jgi:hypothetical protein
LSGELRAEVVMAVYWTVVVGAIRIGFAIPNVNEIIGARLAAGELFSIIDRVSSDAPEVTYFLETGNGLFKRWWRMSSYYRRRNSIPGHSFQLPVKARHQDIGQRVI